MEFTEESLKLIAKVVKYFPSHQRPPIPFKHVPLEYLSSSDCITAIDKINAHLRTTFQEDPLLSNYERLIDGILPLWDYGSVHYAGVSMDETFLNTLKDASEGIGHLFDKLGKLDEYPQQHSERIREAKATFVKMAAEYVPRLAAWSREAVAEIPPSFTNEAVQELAFHIFVSQWSQRKIAVDKN